MKDSDLGSDFFWPIDRDLYYRLMTALRETGERNNRDYYDPFFARKIPGLLIESGFEEIQASTQSFSFVHPVDRQQRMYIAENARMIGDK